LNIPIAYYQTDRIADQTKRDRSGGTRSIPIKFINLFSKYFGDLEFFF